MKANFFRFNIITILLVLSISMDNKKTKILSQTQNMKVFHITSDVDSLNISVSTGETFSIEISGNPTTGYEWNLQNDDSLNSAYIKFIDRDYETDDHPPGFVGVPGKYHFNFKALAASNSIHLIFINKRPWESSAIRTVTVNLSIA